MKGGTLKTRKRQPKKTPPKETRTKKEITSKAESPPSSPSTKKSKGVPGSASPIVSQSTSCSLPSTPKRRRGRKPRRTSTPVHGSATDALSKISVSSPVAKQEELKCNEVITQSTTSETESQCCKSNSTSTRDRNPPSQPQQLRKRVRKEQTETCTETNSPPAKSKRGRKPKIVTGNLQRDAINPSSTRPRPTFELAKQDDSLLSSDLSIELSHYEVPILSFEEDEKSDDEEEELPSYLMQMDKKPPSIREGVFVWCKFRSYPFWPALVKKVNRKQKKASILFIDDLMINKKGFTVALKTMKPFDCEEAKELVCKAKEEYDAAIKWSLELITDYRIRIACGSFSGSFVEYFAHDMSYPVRKMYPQSASERLTIASDAMTEEPFDDNKEDSFSEQQGEVSKVSKRLLPDRTHAAHNRANEKLVHFIVKQRMVERRLLAVIRGQQQSRWLRSYQSANRKRVVNIYLEDDQQLDQVYCYLSDLITTAVNTAPCLVEVKPMEHVPFVLDVLLPEAIIYAIAGVDNVSIKKAEEKYLRGRCLSNRERQEFDLMIERQMRKKTPQQSTEFALCSESMS
ncbi:PWWP domain-containing DNA repair factor 3A [Channa argus]|uniref:PWWP domain-containing DNA repair factor 3A n=1 Tax=Channa argus TaxID=215402 RepID=UPI00352283D6